MVVTLAAHDGDGVEASDVSALQQQLLRELQQKVEATVGSVCSDLQGVLAKRAAQQKQQCVDEDDFEVFNASCKRLVAYIAANMATSPDFTQQMDRIILLCHSDASESVLRSVATKSVWFYRRDVAANGAAVSGAAATASTSSGDIDDAAAAHGFANDSGHVGEPVNDRRVKTGSQDCAPPVRPLVEKVPEAPPAPSMPTPKRQAPAEPSSGRSASKRLRPALRTGSQSAAAANEAEQEEKRDEEETEEELDAEADNNAPEDKVAAIPIKPGSKESLGELPDFLLNFDDPIRDMCYVDKRTRAQTKVFKERLRKAIRFVDAQLCKPPPGKVCTRDCKKLRDVMCVRTIPCSNATCRLWHDVEVHIARCKNTHCELQSRVVLRETWYTIDGAKRQIESLNAKLQAKQREYDLVETREPNRDCERERLLEVTLVQNDISELKRRIAAEEEELEGHEDVVTEHWVILNKVGIELKDDEADGFPDLATHYASRKRNAGKRTAQQSVVAEADKATPRGRDTKRDRRSESSGSTATLINSVWQRTLRRARRESMLALDVEVIDVDSEEESGENSPRNTNRMKEEGGGSKNDRQKAKGGSEK